MFARSIRDLASRRQRRRSIRLSVPGVRHSDPDKPHFGEKQVLGNTNWIKRLLRDHKTLSSSRPGFIRQKPPRLFTETLEPRRVLSAASVASVGNLVADSVGEYADVASESISGFGGYESLSTGNGSISGTNWWDADGDLTLDPGESGLGGWTIYIDANNSGSLDAGEISTVTGSDGAYSFTGLDDGQYVVAQEIQPNWEQTYPSAITPASTSSRTSDASDDNRSIHTNSPYSHPDLSDAAYLEGEVVVKLKQGAMRSGLSGLRTAQSKTGAVTLKTSQLSGHELWKIDSSVEDAILRWANDSRIEYIQPNYAISINTTTPDDPSFNQLWGLHNTGQGGGVDDADIDAIEAWDIQTGSSDIVIGVIDTGIDYNHPDLAGNMWVNPGEIAGNGIDDDNNGYIDDVHGFDFVDYDGDPMDGNAHGTHVAGTIAAEGNNTTGVVGVNWNASLMALRFLDDNGNGSTYGALQALEYATMMGAQITNNSWGGGGFDPAMYNVIAAAGDAGSLFVAAAGNSTNDNDASLSYPASYDLENIISVAATNRNDSLSWFSNYGATTVDLGAPGSSIYSTVPGGGYASFDGTSMASPHVAGVAALVLSQDPTLSPVDLKQIILDSVDPVSTLSGVTLTGGRLNALNAITQTRTPGTHVVSIDQQQAVTGIDFGNRLFNMAPTFDTIDSVALAWNTTVHQVSISNISPGNNESQQLRLSAMSDNIALIPDPVVSYQSPGQDATLTFSPVLDSSGSAAITVTLTDAGIDDDFDTAFDNKIYTQVFTISVYGPLLIDNGSSGFSKTFQWYDDGPIGYGGNPSHWIWTNVQSDNRAEAVWEADVAGNFQVAATWVADSAYDPNATYEIWDGSTLKGSINVDQTASPDADTLIDGTAFQDLGEAWVINTGPLRVVLSNYSSDYGYRVMADAVRIIPDAESLSLTVDDSSISEFSGLASATVTRTDTSGDLVVTLSSDDTSEATVPSTVTILDGQSSATFDIAAVDDSTADGTQTVTVAVSASGYASGSDTFDVTDDEASLVTILDDGESGFTQSGFTEQTNAQVSAAYDGDNHNMQGGSGTASWTFSGLDDGEYQVDATWAHKYDNKYNTLDAPFTIANGGGTLLASATVNQSIAPSAFTYGGYSWDTLGTVNVTGGSLIVTLGAGSSSSKYTVADAIRIEKLSGGGGGGTLGQISGTVWNDVDGDGVYDTSESPLESWFIFLDQNQNGALDSSETAVQTSVDGGYLFEDLPDDTYYVTEILPNGWEQTTPSGGSRNSTVPLGTVQIIDGTSISTAGGWVAEQSQVDFTDISRQSFVNNGNRDFSTSSTQSAGLMNADDFRADPLFSGFNGSGFATVIIDSGADLDHPFYADQLVYSYDFSGADDSDASDFDGHGTNCAGIAVSSDATYTGTAPGSDLIVLKVFTDAGAGSFTDIEEALQWVVSNAATYNIASINMSLGDGGTYNSTQTSQLSDELASLVALDVMVISAAGNEFTTAGTEGISYPAVDPNSLAVSAVWDANNGGPYSWGGGTVDNTTAADRVTSFSSRSSTLTDIFAPGALITNAGLGGGTSSLAGTSQAAPQVAGIATVAQQLATSTLGRRLTQAEFRSLMQSTGVTINDGDDEDDNVTNTGADYSRIDMWALMKGILATAASGDAVHNTTFSGGGTASGLNFGNRVTGSRLASSMEPDMVASAANTDQQAASNLNNISSFNGEKKRATDDPQQVASVQPPLTTIENRVDQLFVGNHRLTHLVDTMFSDGTVTSMPQATSNTLGEETGGSSAEIIDKLLAVNTDPIWSGTSGEDILEREDISQQEDEDASLWLPDEPFYEFFA